jgi:hypothetical protein
MQRPLQPGCIVEKPRFRAGFGAVVNDKMQRCSRKNYSVFLARARLS